MKVHGTRKRSLKKLHTGPQARARGSSQTETTGDGTATVIGKGARIGS